MPASERSYVSKLSARITRKAWQCVEAFQRRPSSQRLVLTTLMVVLVTTAVYLWVSALDCPFC